MLTPTPPLIDHVQRPALKSPWPTRLDAVLSPAMAEQAKAEIGRWPGYAPTPLLSLTRLAEALDLGAVFYKDEGQRLGLGSFKALGGAYAVQRLVAERGGARGLTVATATDGNHGRSVAWGAQRVGCGCRIYIHAHVSPGRQKAMEALGAEVVRIDGDYDASVRECAADAATYGWVVVSDTSYPGYMEIPRDVMAGYSVMASEVLEQLETPPTHVFVQAGVGGLAAAVCARLWQVLGERRPHVVLVEPARAACLAASARAGKPTAVPLDEETVMAGLSCGEVSLLAWEVLALGAAHFITIGEDDVAPAMRLMASGAAGGGSVVAGESAVPGLIGLVGAARAPDTRAAMALGSNSRVLLLGCEGATDPDIYHAMVGEAAPEGTA